MVGKPLQPYLNVEIRCTVRNNIQEVYDQLLQSNLSFQSINGMMPCVTWKGEIYRYYSTFQLVIKAASLFTDHYLCTTFVL